MGRAANPASPGADWPADRRPPTVLCHCRPPMRPLPPAQLGELGHLLLPLPLSQRDDGGELAGGHGFGSSRETRLPSGVTLNGRCGPQPYRRLSSIVLPVAYAPTGEAPQVSQGIRDSLRLARSLAAKNETDRLEATTQPTPGDITPPEESVRGDRPLTDSLTDCFTLRVPRWPTANRPPSDSGQKPLTDSLTDSNRLIPARRGRRQAFRPIRRSAPASRRRRRR